MQFTFSRWVLLVCGLSAIFLALPAGAQQSPSPFPPTSFPPLPGTGAPAAAPAASSAQVPAGQPGSAPVSAPPVTAPVGTAPPGAAPTGTAPAGTTPAGTAPAATPGMGAPADPGAATPAAGQPQPMPKDAVPSAAGQVTAQVTKEGLDQLKGRIDAATDLSDVQRQQALDFIEKARGSLSLEAQLSASLREWQARTEQLDNERRAEQTRLDEVTREPEPQPAGYIPLPQLEQTMATRQQALVQTQTELAQTEKRITDRAARQKAIKERLSAIPLRVEQVKSQASRPDGAGEPETLAEARRLAVLAELKQLEAEPASLQAEAAFLSAQEAANLLSLRRQALTLMVGRLKNEVEVLQREVMQAKTSDAATRARIARYEASETSIPQLKEIYNTNANTIETEIRVRQDIRRTNEQIAATRNQLEVLQRQWDELRQREKNLSGSTSFGNRLREQRRLLQDSAGLRQQIRDRALTNEEAQVNYIEAREARMTLDRLDRVIEQTLNQIVPSDATDEERRTIANEVQDALEQRQTSLAELESTYEAYVAALDQLDVEQDALIKQQISFQAYINERILWVPTQRRLTFAQVVEDSYSLQRMLSLKSWEPLIAPFRADLQEHPFMYLAAALIWAIMLATQGTQRARIREYGQKASSRLNTNMAPTWGAVAWTLLRTFVAPFPLLFLAWRGMLTPSPMQEYFGYLLNIAIWFWWLEAVRLTCRPLGLGPSHFQWPTRMNEGVSRQVSVFIVLGVPLALVILLLRVQSTPGGTDAIQRVCTVLFFLLVAVSLHQLMSRKTGIFQEWIQAHPNGWTSLFSRVGHFVAVLLPVFLASLTIAGYTFAASRLTVRLAQTLILITGAIFAHSLLFRWLTLRQRNLAIAHAREVRAALATAQNQEEGSNAAVLEAQEARTNLAEVSTQSRRLLNTTFVTLSLCWIWLIWTDVLPALQRLDQIHVPGLAWTLDKVLIGILQLILFATAARNIPGLIEITLLERLPLDRSSRYAVGTLIRYMIVIIGVLAVGKTLEMKWDQLQWLVAALTFSLGFGLQEIFANFVSGIIILFEQPVRVGDVVTLDGVTGTVNRVRIRATSIIDADKKEYIVPNKAIITGKVLNWTLSDTVNRVTFNIATSVEADPQQVREVLLKVLTTQPNVMTDPAPFVLCDGIKDNSMNFTMGVFLPSMEFRSETIHGVHARARQAFLEKHIELAHPERELRLPTAIPVTVNYPQNGSSAPEGRTGGSASGSSNANANGNGSSNGLVAREREEVVD